MNKKRSLGFAFLFKYISSFSLWDDEDAPEDEGINLSPYETMFLISYKERELLFHWTIFRPIIFQAL